MWRGLLLLIFLQQWIFGLAEPPVVNISVEGLMVIAEKLTPKLDYGSRALKIAPAIKRSLIDESANRKKLLCMTFISWEDKTIDLLVRNMNHTIHHCDWLIIAYNAQEKTNLEMELHIQHLLHLKGIPESERARPDFINVLTAPHKEDSIEAFRLLCDLYASNHIHPDYLSEVEPCAILTPVELEAYNPILYSKASLFMLTLEYLPKYQYAWALDSDIDTTQLKLNKFFTILNCAFKYPPLVSQALINENTQFYRYLYRASWKNSKALATGVGFVEIQAPIFETTFLQYFTMAFVVPLIPAMVVLGADWGYDELFCPAAKEFLKQRKGKKAKIVEPVCAAVLNNMANHHLNFGQIAHSVGIDIKRGLNFGLMHLVHTHFGPLAQHGLLYHTDPFNAGTRYKRVYRLQPNCTN